MIEPPEHAEEIIKMKVQEAKAKARMIDISQVLPQGKIAPQDAYRRSFIDFKDIKRKKRTFQFPSTDSSMESS